VFLKPLSGHAPAVGSEKVRAEAEWNLDTAPLKLKQQPIAANGELLSMNRRNCHKCVTVGVYGQSLPGVDRTIGCECS
jgi:hypothetical protein